MFAFSWSINIAVGEIRNGGVLHCCMRVFGFDAGLRRKLVDFEDNKKAVTLTNTDRNCAHAIKV